MVSKVVSASVLLTCLCMLVTADRKHCQSTFCLNFLRLRLKIDFNIVKDKPLPLEDYIRQSGYPVESHDITTEDGYILTYHRIPHGKASSVNSTHKTPVLVQHGLLAASSVWVMSQEALAYTLADAGFDVWLGNARGNTYSRRHVKYDPKKDKKSFWDFSWHEMGYYDLPVTIDYILNMTETEQLFYIGHSMGTTMYFVLGATRPEYMNKIQAMVAMAPVVYPWNIRSPLANFIKNIHWVLNLLAKTFGIYEIFPYSDTLFWLDENICARKQFQFICRDLLFYIGGFDDKELNRTSLSTVLQYTPAGASYKQVRHYRQISSKGSDFKQYDYGYIENFCKYGTFNPPLYNLTKVKTPVYVYYGTNDWLAVPEDVFHAVDHLPNVKKVTKVPDDRFNHLDFMWAIDGKQLVYDDIVSTILSLTVH